jgi:NADPH-dependent 2,4-dienoyl-CoA reductase/sulfur reductase-like enzyme
MMKTAGLVPSGRLVLIGCGGLLYDAARQCLEQGAPPLAILDITPPGRLHGALRLVPREAGRDEVRAAVALRRMLREAGIRVLGGVTSCRLVGTDGVAAVAFVHRGERETIDCDMVGLHAGLVPATQFARLIGCRLRWNAGRCCFEPEVDTYGNTSVGGVLIAGDGAGIEDGGAAACRGEMSGWEALRHLGRITTGERDRGCVPLLRERAARRAVRPMLEHLETPAEAVLRPADEVMACRCEEVTAGAIRAAAAEGVRHVDELKGALRCGMGPCQGRICGAIAAALVAEGSGRTMDEVGLFRVRVPLKPIPMREMAECSLTAGAGAAAN